MIYNVVLKPGVDSDAAWGLFEEAGVQVLYASEADGLSEIVIEASTSPNYPFIQSAIPIQLPDIDYAAEWEKHALHYKEGKVHLELCGKTIFLKPGAGFGDLSHPTTRLCLELMEGRVQDKTLIDIGCGSGVLSLAAIAYGAKNAVGIDINADAVAHAKENAALNYFQVHFCHPDEPFEVDGPIVVVMNMISSEQEVAWRAFMKRNLSGVLITSGVLKEQQEEYRAFAEQFGWSIQEIFENEGWLGFVMTFVHGARKTNQLVCV